MSSTVKSVKSLAKNHLPPNEVLMQYATFAWMHSRMLGYFVLTATLITALPLFIEVKRESILEELEQMQIKQGLAEGKTPINMAQMGLSGAVDPKVLNVN